MQTNFSELQVLTQQKSVKWIFRIAFFVHLSGIVIGLAIDKSMFETFIVICIVTLLLYILFRKLGMKTKVDSTELKVNHPFVGSFTIPMSEIASTEKVSLNFPDNRRIYHKKFGTLYRMYGSEGVFIKIQDSKPFFIGSQKADELQKVIQHKLKKHNVNEAD
ncbi:hypothetical protein [Psychroflexus planctonicus]|uniref:PH domain-containing protein n=1 Tax=Psychroflexus planctonicus TaxID=1526575 RepID=A0ABQ1SBV3_9FLAO|nr:hypothetical protein [Psychroflexus planctonicus]GGE26276.1 hypothetical protein GCM10010832_03740 [Psychroflexus planctonicus]